MEFDLAAGTAVLQRTPGALRAMLAGLPEPWLTSDEGPETFTVVDNLGHLIHGERADWIPRAQLILAQGSNRRFEPVDRFAHRQESRGKSTAELLDELAELRSRNLSTLTSWNLTEAQLALEGEHPALGRVTLRQLLATWVAHDLGHIAQIARVMAKQYREAIGPWAEFLPVVNDRLRPAS
jgi:uncharacterized damage-inducible protein DinB